MEPFKLFVLNEISSREGHIVRATLTDDVYRQLVDASQKTNISLQQICGRAIEYALNNLEFIGY